MIEIRQAQEDDIPAVLEIERAVFSTPWTEGQLLSEQGADKFFAIAVRGGELLGYCILRTFGEEAELYKIAVEAHSRRRGIARLLMAAAMAYAAENSISKIYLEVRAGNVPAISLYKKYGFVAVGRRRGYYENPVEDAVVMAHVAEVDFL